MVIQASNNFARIIPTEEIKEKYPKLYWGGNGVGDRFAKKKFNYSVIHSNKPPSLYSENEDDKVPQDLLDEFILQYNTKRVGIIGIYVHSFRENVQKRPICKSIHKEIAKMSCVVCGSTHQIVCDHKNDLYNDPRVLDNSTQTIDDFQPLCNHCNLQKRAVCISEKQTGKIYSAKNIRRYKSYPFEFPWEKKAFDETDILCKNGSYWFDPVEFDRNIFCYTSYVIPVLSELKRRIKMAK
jgi:hypothetical protein